MVSTTYKARRSRQIQISTTRIVKCVDNRILNFSIASDFRAWNLGFIYENK